MANALKPNVYKELCGCGKHWFVNELGARITHFYTWEEAIQRALDNFRETYWLRQTLDWREPNETTESRPGCRS
jgi:hypothetical protein